MPMVVHQKLSEIFAEDLARLREDFGFIGIGW